MNNKDEIFHHPMRNQRAFGLIEKEEQHQSHLTLPKRAEGIRKCFIFPTYIHITNQNMIESVGGVLDVGRNCEERKKELL